MAPPSHPAAGRPREHGGRAAAAGKGLHGEPRPYPLHGARRPPAAGGCSAPWGAGPAAAPDGRHRPRSAQGHPGAAMREGRRFPRKRPREFRPPPAGSGGSAERGAAPARAAPAPATREREPAGWYSRLTKQSKKYRPDSGIIF